MLPASDPLVLVLPRYAKGGQPDPRNVAVPLSVALTRAWAFDAHVVQYAPSDPPVRWNEEHVAEHPYRIGVAFFDFDAHELPPEQIQAWSDAALAKLPPGFQGYRTSGGFRAVTLLAEPHVVCDAESWNAWHAFSAGLGAALSAVLGVQADKACTDPGRIFRLPNARQEAGKPCFPELYGTLGVGTLAPLPVEPRAALQRPNDPNATGGDTLLGALFAAAGLVQGEQGAKLVVTCPWAAEHSGGDTSGTVVMPDPDGIGLGKFHCAHGNTCGKAKGHFTWAAVAKLLELPAVRAEARYWPEPSLLSAYARAPEPGPMPEWAVTRGAPEPDTLDDPLLALELTEAQIHAVTYRLEHPVRTTISPPWSRSGGCCARNSLSSKRGFGRGRSGAGGDSPVRRRCMGDARDDQLQPAGVGVPAAGHRRRSSRERCGLWRSVQDVADRGARLQRGVWCQRLWH
jgi:hypothetical protein